MNIYDPNFYTPGTHTDVAKALQELRAAQRGARPPRREPNMWQPQGGGGNPADMMAALMAPQAGAAQAAQLVALAHQAQLPPVAPPSTGVPTGYPPGVAPQANMGALCTPEMLRHILQVYGPDAMARVVWATRGGTVAQGYPCAPQPTPQLQVDERGCEIGWKQCRLPLPVNALDVLPNEIVDIIISPPYDAVSDQFIYTGPTNTFVIEGLRIGLTDYIQGPIPSDIYNASSNGADYSVQWAPYSASTPAVMSVRNISPFIANHRGATQTRATRQGG